jgi:hypothetical protein
MVGNYYTGNNANGNTKKDVINWATEYNGKLYTTSGEGEMIVPDVTVIYDIPNELDITTSRKDRVLLTPEMSAMIFASAIRRAKAYCTELTTLQI